MSTARVTLKASKFFRHLWNFRYNNNVELSPLAAVCITLFHQSVLKIVAYLSFVNMTVVQKELTDQEYDL